VDTVPVAVARERTYFRDAAGNLVAESVKDFTRKQVLQEFALMDEFINQWSSAEKKCAIIHQLEEKGLPLAELEQAVGRDYDPFDLILHVAYDQPPLTRKERADRVRKKNYFARYGAKARAVMEALLDRYADQGLETLESPDVLKVIPFPQIGTPVELIHAFGSRNKYVAALRDLEAQLYKTA
jgi:type I restriction enzyme R subunit